MDDTKDRKKGELLPAEIVHSPKESLARLISSGVYDIQILDSITSNILITDDRFRITYINPAAGETFGISPEEAVGREIFSLGLEGIGMNLRDNLRKVLKEGTTFNIKAVQYHNPTDEVRFLDIAYMPLMGKDNRPVGIIFMGNDATQRIVEERRQLALRQEMEERIEKERQGWEIARSEFESRITDLEKELSERMDEIRMLRFNIDDRYIFHNIVARNKRMREIIELIPKIADTDATVLITGETGTGKELIARAIHYTSYRRDRRFIGINCATLSETLLESELFGHVRGAFTGAIRDKQGKFELADGGTIFLDEVSEMQPTTQGKLLRVLQEQEFEKVGGEKTIRVDVRVIAATNRDIESLVSQGRFREDLYYRLKVITIHLPPLRERMDDIPLLANFFLRKYSKKLSRDVVSISQKALGKMLSYHWPGNVRELEHVIEKAVIMTEGDIIDDVDIPVKTRKKHKSLILPAVDMTSYLESCEQDYLRELLRQFRGNIKKVSEVSGLNRRTIHNKMKKYNLRKEDFK